MATKLSEAEMNELKEKVLIGRMDYLSGELGDPGRYFPFLRAKGVLSPDDCEKIRGKVANSEKVYEMIELIHKRRSEKDDCHALDVFMEALRKQRVQAHIARELQRALAKAKEERTGDEMASPVALPSHSRPPSLPTYRQPSTVSLPTPISSITTPATSTGQASTQFDIHPQFGALPPNRPAKHVSSSPVVQPSSNIHPEFGVLPPTPPTRQGMLQPSEEAGNARMGVATSGISHHIINDSSNSLTGSGFSVQHYQNGDRQAALGRRFSDLSYSTTSGTVYSTSSTEQSGLDCGGRSTKGFGGGTLQEMEAKFDQLNSMYQKRDLECIQLKKENSLLSSKVRDIEDQYAELKKRHDQLRQKMRSATISGQQTMFDNFKSGKMDESEITKLCQQLEEKNHKVAILENQVEQYQHENQRLQLSLSTSSSASRPHHLPLVNRPLAVVRPPFTPSRSTYQGGVGDTYQGNAVGFSGPGVTAGITPIRSMRVGDSLNQHNIHLQQSRSSSSRIESPSYSPAKESGNGKRLSSGSGDTPMGETYYQSSNSSLNSSGSKGSAGVMLQTVPNAEHSTMV